MPRRNTIILAILGLAAFFAVDAVAQQHGTHGGHDGAGSATTSSEKADETVGGEGVVHHVDAGARTVNLTHEPIPAIGWPAMTMDLAVADDIDLTVLEAGERVRFALDRGTDGIYMITEIDPVD